MHPARGPVRRTGEAGHLNAVVRPSSSIPTITGLPMKAVNPYLNFPGTTEQAFLFYRSVFGGEFAVLQRFGDLPNGDQTPAQDRTKIMHVSLPLPNGSVLMGTDACESVGHKLIVGNNFSISLECDSEAEVSKLFTTLTTGGKAEMS